MDLGVKLPPEGRVPSPRPDKPASTTHARISLPSDVCISANLQQLMRCRSAAPMRSRAHLLSSPPSFCRKRADKEQGERGRGIGLCRAAGGFRVGTSLRARAQAPALRP